MYRPHSGRRRTAYRANSPGDPLAKWVSFAAKGPYSGTIRGVKKKSAILKERIKRLQRPGPDSQAPMLELPRFCPPNTHPSRRHTTPDRALEKCPGAGGSRLGSAPHKPASEAAEGSRGGGGPGRARGREEAPAAGGRERQTPRRGTRAAGGGSEQRPGGGRWKSGRPGGDPESSMKYPRGCRRGAGLGRLSGGPRHPWQGGGRGGALGVSRGWGRAPRGKRPELGRNDSGPGQATRLLCLGVSRRRLLGARWSSQPRSAQFGGFFGNLQMFS
jgi:hypothetical protein